MTIGVTPDVWGKAEWRTVVARPGNDRYGQAGNDNCVAATVTHGRAYTDC